MLHKCAPSSGSVDSASRNIGISTGGPRMEPKRLGPKNLCFDALIGSSAGNRPAPTDASWGVVPMVRFCENTALRKRISMFSPDTRDVLVQPGCEPTARTCEMPAASSRRCSSAVNTRLAAFERPYAGHWDRPSSVSGTRPGGAREVAAAEEHDEITARLGAASSSGIRAAVRHTGPRWLVPHIISKPSAVVEPIGTFTPALFTRISKCV
mmetsp:Transcript_26109/g.81433  ORF Transcript_26109/g.81433 Transcript_26109/m.81433 type:complete len:210 (-) Transcript_26109:235-864(-)